MDDIAPVFVVLIVFSFAFAFVKMIIQHQQKKLQIKSGFLANKSVNAELVQEITQLKERIAVLEKIVTDDKYDLKKQFDNLDAA